MKINETKMQLKVGDVIRLWEETSGQYKRTGKVVYRNNDAFVFEQDKIITVFNFTDTKFNIVILKNPVKAKDEHDKIIYVELVEEEPVKAKDTK